MTSHTPQAGQLVDYYTAIEPLLRLAWDDNLHFGYWESATDPSTIQQATDRFTDLLVDRLGVGPGDRVLDVGCGIGKPALRLAARTGADVVGITIAPAQAERATAAAAAAGLADRVRFDHGDAMRMPYADGTFDAVLAFESILHMDRPTALAEIARVLRPGGRLVLTDVTPLPDAPPDRPRFGGADAPPPEDHVASTVEVGDYPGLFAAAGLDTAEVTDVTEHTRHTFMRLMYSILDHRQEFERVTGTSLEEALGAAKAAQPEVTGVGCLVAVARKV